MRLGLSASYMAQGAVDVALHAAGVVEQPLRGLEHFVRGRESRVGMTVQVDYILRHRSRTVRGRLRTGENAGGRNGLLPDAGRDFSSQDFEIFDCRNDVAEVETAAVQVSRTAAILRAISSVARPLC